MFEIDVDKAKIIPGPDGNVRIQIENMPAIEGRIVVITLLQEKVCGTEEIFAALVDEGKELELLDIATDNMAAEHFLERLDDKDILDYAFTSLDEGANLTRVLSAMLDEVDAETIQKKLDILKKKKR